LYRFGTEAGEMEVQPSKKAWKAFKLKNCGRALFCFFFSCEDRTRRNWQRSGRMFLISIRLTLSA